MIQCATSSLAGRPYDRVNRPLMRGDSCGFLIGRWLATAATILLVRIIERCGQAIVAVDQIGAFIGMAMAAQHQVHSASLQDRQKIFPHFDELDLGVRIMRALAVWRMMPE